MIETKTITNKEDLTYYKVFGWKKLGEYHGPSKIGYSGIVSVEGKMMQKIKNVDEYYLGRDTRDSRYDDWISCEKDFKRYYDLNNISRVKVDKYIRRKTRKVAVITSTIFYILSLIGLALCVIFAIWPTFLGIVPSVYGDTNAWWQLIGRKFVLITLALLQIFIASWIVLHKSRAKKLKRLPAIYKSKSRNAFKKAAELSNVYIGGGKDFIPLD